MNQIKRSLIAWAMVVCLPALAVAQNACDKLFSEGVKLQQTMTISSQRRAIDKFEKAKICYDSQVKKDLCDQQIKACRNIIGQLEKNNSQATKDTLADTAQITITTGKPNQSAATAARREVELSLSETYVKFKGKGNEFRKVRVKCNYNDWEVSEAPDWVNCSRNEDNEIVIEAEKNPSKSERSGILKVRCGNVETSLTIIQEKYKKFIVI